MFSFFDWFKFVCVIYIRQKGLQAFQSAPVKTLKFVGRPVSHKALSLAALLRGRSDGVVVNTSALESRGHGFGFKSRSGQFLGFSLCVCLYIYIYIYIYIHLTQMKTNSNFFV